MTTTNLILNAGTTQKVHDVISTTIFTTAEKFAIPRTLYLEKKEGSGKVFLDSRTVFYPDWQHQLDTVLQFVRKFFKINFHWDFFISVNSQAVDGWSTSVPLFLLFASAVSGEPLPNNIFSTGCMFSPDGWISHGKFEAVQAKIDAAEAFSRNTNVENPEFLIPFSFHEYHSENVRLYSIKSVFSALKKALPQTFHMYQSRTEKFQHMSAQAALQGFSLPSAGDLFVILSAENQKQEQPKQLNLQTKAGIPIILEKVPSDQAVHLYFIHHSVVIFKHTYRNTDQAHAAASHYKEVLP